MSNKTINPTIMLNIKLILASVSCLCVSNVCGLLANCTIDETLTSPDFDEDGFFSGVWLTAARTHWMWGDDTWTGGVVQLSTFTLPVSDGNFSGRYIAFMSKEQRCSPVLDTIIVPDLDRPGYYTPYRSTNSNIGAMVRLPGYIQVIFTDYSTAVIHRCHQQHGDGTCVENRRGVTFWSRKLTMDDATSVRLSKHLPSLCATIDDMVPQQPVQCFLTPHRVNQEQEDVDNAKGVNERRRCTLDSIPVSDNFTFNMLSGLWYHPAMTQFTTYAKLDSGMSYYSTQNESHISTLIGAINGTCLRPVTGMSIHDPSSSRAGDLLGKLGGFENPHAWFPFRVLFADSEHLVMYACYGQTNRGDCHPNMHQVEVMSRYPYLSHAVLGQMRGYMSRVCLRPGDLNMAPATLIDECKAVLVSYLNTTTIPAEGRDSMTEYRLREDEQLELDDEDV